VDQSDIWFYGGVFGYGRSDGDNFSFKKSKMAASGHIGYTKLAINGHKFDAMFDYREV